MSFNPPPILTKYGKAILLQASELKNKGENITYKSFTDKLGERFTQIGFKNLEKVSNYEHLVRGERGTYFLSEEAVGMINRFVNKNII
jgi:hypothetical protein